MPSEALRNIRTMRQVKTSLDVAGSRKLRTTSSLSKTREEVERLESLTDPRREQTLQKERRRFAVQEAVVNKSRQRVLQARDKLAVTINRNCALTELRHKLQRARWEGLDPPTPERKPQASGHKLRQIELRY